MSASSDTIVVGVDGSEGAAAALAFAAGEAAFRGARLRIVSAWQVAVVAVHADLVPPLDPATWDAFRVRAQKIADDALAEVTRLHPSLEGEALGIQGQAADVLLEQG